MTPLLRGPRLLAWEMVGYGESIAEGRGRDISVAAQAGYLFDWMRAIGVGPAVFVGHDLGGGVAQIAATRDRDTCAGLVLMNAISYDSWPIPSVKALRAAGDVVERLPNGAVWALFAPLLFRGHDDLGRAREALKVHTAPYLRTDGPAALIRQVRSLDPRDTLEVAPDLPTLRLPDRLVWGASDRFQKIGYGRRLARDLEARLTQIPKGKHFVPEDHPDVVADAIRELWEQVRARGEQSAAAT